MSDFLINVNCIAPGPIKTDLLKGITDNQVNKIVSNQIIQRHFEKSDICDVVEEKMQRDNDDDKSDSDIRLNSIELQHLDGESPNK